MAKRKSGTATKGHPKAHATPAHAKPAHAKPATADKQVDWRKTAAARVRMYRHGLGDCFLLSFPRPHGRDYRILIDCGVILGTPNQDEVIRQVVKDLKEATDEAGTPTIDVLVATHEHWDHLSGFATAQDDFNDFDIGQVWMAWTEDPTDETAKKLRKERDQKLNALRLGVAHLRAQLAAGGALGADGNSGPAADDFRRVAEVLTFFGVDPDEPPPTADGLGAAAKAGKLGITDAMNWCRDRPAGKRKFWTPGDLIDVKEVKGLRAYVLGPPTSRQQLFKDLPTKKGRETYDMDVERALAAASQAFLGADVGQARPERSHAEFDRTTPFGPKYRIPMDEAARTEFFRAHYFGTGTDDPEGWRRIDGGGLTGAAEFALQLDSDTNNTSLALAFELPDGRVLLFPGDAQVGNWESWHADPDGVKREWKVDGRTLTAEELLNRTVLYKVGHHGSHNATLRGKGLEMMTDKNLVALVPVDTYIAHEKKHWDKMPFDPLMEALRDHTKGRLIVADQPIADMPKGFLAGQAVDADETITVAGPKGKEIKRPLYVDYFVPLS
jgi:glyoxylase-like metal-dependent hydrolase (beta-lactamase superfamily II)